MLDIRTITTIANIVFLSQNGVIDMGHRSNISNPSTRRGGAPPDPGLCVDPLQTRRGRTSEGHFGRFPAGARIYQYFQCSSRCPGQCPSRIGTAKLGSSISEIQKEESPFESVTGPESARGPWQHERCIHEEGRGGLHVCCSPTRSRIVVACQYRQFIGKPKRASDENGEATPFRFGSSDLRSAKCPHFPHPFFSPKDENTCLRRSFDAWGFGDPSRFGPRFIFPDDPTQLTDI